MKKVFALVILSICMTAPSFAKDVVGHSAKVAGKGTAKTAKGTAKGAAKAAKGTTKGAAVRGGVIALLPVRSAC